MSGASVFVRAAASAALEHKLRKLQIVDYAAYAKLTLLLYEIIINLGREVRLVWSTKFRWSNVVYYMNRYPVVAFQIWSVCYTASTPHCDALYQFFWYASFIPTRTAITASFALRVYAVSHGKGKLFYVGLLCLLGLIVVILDVVQGVQSSCTESSNQLSTVLTFIFLACFDVMSTLIVCISMIQAIDWSGGIKSIDTQTIVGYILRSGVMYFGVVTIPQLIAIALYFAPQGLYSTVLNNFMLVLSSIMVARFLLDLREMNERTIIDTDGPGTLSTSLASPQTHPPTTLSFRAAVNPHLNASDTMYDSIPGAVESSQATSRTRTHRGQQQNWKWGKTRRMVEESLVSDFSGGDYYYPSSSGSGRTRGDLKEDSEEYVMTAVTPPTSSDSDTYPRVHKYHRDRGGKDSHGLGHGSAAAQLNSMSRPLEDLLWRAKTVEEAISAKQGT